FVMIPGEQRSIVVLVCGFDPKGIRLSAGQRDFCRTCQVELVRALAAQWRSHGIEQDEVAVTPMGGAVGIGRRGQLDERSGANLDGLLRLLCRNKPRDKRLKRRKQSQRQNSAMENSRHYFREPSAGCGSCGGRQHDSSEVSAHAIESAKSDCGGTG